MCLSIVDKDGKLKPIKYGYVVVAKTAKGNYAPAAFEHSPHGEKWVARPNTWHRATPVRRYSQRRYVRGFHVWHTLDDAKRWLWPINHGNLSFVIVKVAVRDIICTGWQEDRPVTVAWERKIIREVA